MNTHRLVLNEGSDGVDPDRELGNLSAEADTDGLSLIIQLLYKLSFSPPVSPLDLSVILWLP